MAQYGLRTTDYTVQHSTVLPHTQGRTPLMRGTRSVCRVPEASTDRGHSARSIEFRGNLSLRATFVQLADLVWRRRWRCHPTKGCLINVLANRHLSERDESNHERNAS